MAMIRKRKSSEATVSPSNTSSPTTKKEGHRKKRRKGKKPHKAAKKQSEEDVTSSSQQEEQNTAQQEELEQIVSATQTAWCSATGGVMLHRTLCQALLKQQWLSPMPIQSAALPAAMLGRRNIVGAAPTGSGKTLAYLLPIAQVLLEEQILRKQQDNEIAPCLRALILTPTRELALQVQDECLKLLKFANVKGKNAIGTLVGGLAAVKQQRVLEKDRPHILVGTVGRCWELVRGSCSCSRS